MIAEFSSFPSSRGLHSVFFHFCYSNCASDRHANGRGIWNQSHSCSEDDYQDSDPNPIYQGINDDFDDGMAGIAVQAFIDDVKVFAKGGVVRDNVNRLSAAGFKEAFFRIQASEEFAIFVNFK